MPSDQRNLTMVKAMSLILLPFDFTSAQEVLFGIMQYTQGIFNGLTNVLLRVPFIFADSKKCQFCCRLPFTTEIVRIYQL